MSTDNRVPLVLLLLRLSVFLVMMWTLDKFVRPEHAASVYQHFYLISGLGNTVVYLIGAVEMGLLVGFLLGIRKQFTYGAVVLLHAVSTLSSVKQYLAPFTGGNLLFFAAWPMLAACIALYVLRDMDTRWTMERQ